MSKSQSTKKSISLGKKYEQYIIDHIDAEGYDLPSDALITTEGRLHFLYDTFIKEYGFEQNIRRYGSLQNCFKEWLMGLPSAIDLPFYNVDIIDLAKEMGSISENATKKQEERIIENYWNFMAKKAFVLFRKFKIN